MRLSGFLIAGPFVKAGHWHDAAPIAIGVPKHRLFRDGLDPCIERGGKVLELFFPPIGNEAPAHFHELALSLGIEPHDIDKSRGRDIVAGLDVLRRPKEAQEVMDLGPRIILRESSAHEDG